MEKFLKNNKKVAKRRSYPFHQLKQAQIVGETIQEANSGLPMDRFLLAKALNTTPKSSGFIIKLNSSARYGITNGGYNDPTISLTELGKSIVSSKNPDEYQHALVECSIKPDVFRDFYQRMDGKQLPEEGYAKNILERDHQIDQDLSRECYETIVANGLHANIIRKVKGEMYVNLSAALQNQTAIKADEIVDNTEYADDSSITSDKTNRVFIGHFGDLHLLKVVEDLLYEFNIAFQIVDLSNLEKNRFMGKVNIDLKACQSAVILLGMANETDQINQVKLPIIVGAASALHDGKVVVIADDATGKKMAQLGLNVVCVKNENAISEIQILKTLNNTNVINITV